MSARASATILAIAASLAATPAAAELPPLVLQDMTSQTKLSLSVAEASSQGVHVGPLLTAQRGLGPISMGVVLPFLVGQMGQPEGILGSAAVFARGGHCLERATRVCLGAALAVGVGTFDGSGNRPHTYGENLRAQFDGMLAHQDPAYYSFMALTLRPLAVASLERGRLWTQVEVGAAYREAFQGSHPPEGWALLGRAGLGFRVASAAAIFTEYVGQSRAFMHLGGVHDGALMWVNAGARVKLGRALPVVRVSVPLTEAAGGFAPQVAAGVDVLW